MDADRFDRLTRTFSTVAPRRTALDGALGSTLTMLLNQFGAEEAGARHKKKKKRKNRCKPQCAGKTCGDNGCGGSCGEWTDGLTCDGNSCACPAERACGAV